MTDEELINSLDPKELLIRVMNGMGLEITKVEGNHIFTIHNYKIEVEGKSLYKLSHKGLVVAPFNDIIQMIEFIKMQ